MEKVRSNKVTIAVFALISGVIALTVRILCSSPYRAVHMYGAGEVLPPVPLFVLLFMLGGIVYGALCGGVLSLPGADYRVTTYKGMIYLLLSFISYLLGYALFIKCLSPFLSLVASLSVMLFLVLCFVSWWTVSKGAKLCIVGLLLLQFFFFVLDLLVLCKI